jgi:hypothetical protein
VGIVGISGKAVLAFAARAIVRGGQFIKSSGLAFGAHCAAASGAESGTKSVIGPVPLTLKTPAENAQFTFTPQVHCLGSGGPVVVGETL